jgi:histidinol-phosphate aminotransferase
VPRSSELPAGFVRDAVASLVPYEPGKPLEEVQRELGLARVVKLASNEGPLGPFPAALDALARGAGELNRYPDGGSYLLREALAARHGVAPAQIALGGGADGVLDCLSQAVLAPGDEIACGWPSFPSYVIYARKQGASPMLVPLRDHTYDLEAILAAVTTRTKLVYICHPNNPTGTANTRDELDAYFARVPEHVLTVVDQAYYEYVEGAAQVDALEYLAAGRSVLVLRTFSKIYGLAGLRVGYGVGSLEVAAAIARTRRPFDLTSPAQAAALASLDAADELARRRALNVAGRAQLEEILGRHGLEPAGPAVANFVYVEVGPEAQAVFDRLLSEGVIVRPLQGFGAPQALRVTVGTREENDFLDSVLARSLPGTPTR